MIFLISQVRGLIEVRQKNQYEEVSNLVRKLIVEMNFKDSTTRDVVFLKFMVNEKSQQKLDDIIESVIKLVPKNNIVTTPKLREVTRNERTRKAAMIIIVSDSSDGVSRLKTL